MANSEHLQILKQGVEKWNVWRQENRHVRPDLEGANLEGADLKKANLSMVNLADANLTQANLEWTFCEGTYFTRACLRKVKLLRSNLDDAVLIEADLREAELRVANFTSANMESAVLAGAILDRTRLNSANLSGADFRDAVFYEVELIRTDLTAAKGLETVTHRGPSTLDHRTLAKSTDLSVDFLRGCGLPDVLINYIPSLQNEPDQFYSCFISFTEADDDFAQRLYNDLQSGNVKCWRWKEDARWGRSLIGEIDQAVQVYDRIIVVCSEESLRSKPVIREIERALRREADLFRHGNQADILFPIRLDDYIFRGWKHPLKADLLEKNIGDFRDWRNNDKYQASLKRLRHDLRIE